jgi:hypothetical protein
MRKRPVIGLVACCATMLAAVPTGSAAPAGSPHERPAAARGSDAGPVAGAAKRCHPNYRGRCLKRNASDYDCAGGSGNGPYWVSGPFRRVGSDPYRLDSDGDGIACER